jgi:hypothetical protein
MRTYAKLTVGIGVEERERLLLFLWAVTKLGIVSNLERWNVYDGIVYGF